MKYILIFFFLFSTAKAQVKDTLVDFLPPLTKAVSGNTVSVSVNFTPINDSLKKHRADIQSLQAFDNAQKATNTSLQNQINNIVVPPGAGIKPTRTITGSTTLSVDDYDRDISANCSCVITIPNVPDGWKVRVWRTGSGTPTFKSANGTVLGYVSVRGGMVNIASFGANNPKVSVR